MKIMRENNSGKQRVRALLLILLAGTLTACGSTALVERDYRYRELPADAPTIAVVPLENLSDSPNAGVIGAQLLSLELYRTREFRLREESEVRKALFDNKVDVERLDNSSYARQVAKQLKVDAVLVGSVTEYGYQHGLQEEPTVGMNARLVRGCDGAVLWAAGYGEVGRGYLHRDSVYQSAQRVAARMVAGLSRLDGSELRCDMAFEGELTMTLNVQFASRKADIEPAYFERLLEVADFMRRYPDAEAVIEGHTDSRGSEEYNQELSQARADSVRRFLIERGGVAAERLTAIGYGESRPLADNSSEEGRQRNRRIVAVFKRPKTTTTEEGKP